MIRTISLNPWWAEGLMLQHGMSIEAIIEKSAAMGVDGVDMQEAYLGLNPNPDLQTIQYLRKLVASFGLEVTSCWFYADVLGVAGLYSAEAAARFIKQYLAITSTFESRYLVIQNGEPMPGMSTRDGRTLLMHVYEQIVPTAEAYGITVGFEAARALSPFNSPQGALDLVREFGSKVLTVVPDFEAWRRPTESMPIAYVENPGMVQADPLSIDIFRECLPHAPFIHAKFLEFDESGTDPNYPTEELLAVMLTDSNEHDISVEYEGWLPEIHPELDPIEQTKMAMALVRRCLGIAR